MTTVRRLLLYFLIASVVLFEGAVLLSVSTPQGRAGVKAVLFIPQVLADMPLKPLELLTRKPTREMIEFPLAEGMGSADLYLPHGSGRHSAVLFYLGVVPPDRDESRVVALGEALARSGVVVMIPWLQTQVQNKIVPEDIDGLVRGFQRLRELDRVDPDRVGMGGISTGASMATVAAQDERIRSQVRFVNFFAGYYDASDLVRAIGSRSRFYGDRVARWDPDELTVRLLTEHLIDGVADPDDKAALIRMLIDKAPNTDGGPVRLTEEGFAVYRLIQGEAFEDVDELMEQLSPETKEFLDLISPATHIDRLEARMLMMHDRADRLVPSEESRRLAESLGNESDTYYTEFSLFQSAIQVHTDGGGDLGPLDYVSEAFKLFRHMYVVMREVS
ncbi:MAG: hypothetical protein O3A47_06315 [Chloroflexi bacterium]|nr:hypothetical protein [Chloroflexota bacterium]